MEQSRGGRRREKPEATYNNIQHGSKLRKDQDFMALIEQSVQ